MIEVYESREKRVDRIYGNQFEWDENQGIARAVGEVQMDLQLPSSVVATQRHGSPATAGGAENIHVRTSGLVFVRNLGIAATPEQIEFSYKGLTCLAKGAEFDNSPSALHLLTDVRIDGVMHQQPVVLHAVKADLDRDSNVVSFVQPVLETGDRKARADSAVLHLRRDGSVERAEGSGGVVLDTATAHVTAPRLDATMDAKNTPQTAKLSGGVKLVDTDAKRPTQGEAGEVRLRFDAAGHPAEVTAVNGAHLLTKQAGAGGVWLEREMRGNQIVAELHTEGRKGKPQLQSIHATGAASMRGQSLAKAVGTQPRGMKATNVAADDLLANFVPDGPKKVRIDKLHGQGHTVLRQTAPLAEEHTSTGDTLDVVFAAGGAAAAQTDLGQVSLASATQVGHVTINNRAAIKPGSKKAQDVSTGSADRAVYDGASEKLSLRGGVHLVDAGTAVAADSVVVDQKTQDAVAQGNVAATLAGSGSAEPTHVTAQQATLHKATQLAVFEGSPAKQARLWQDASQVEAATILVDRQNKTLVARPATAGGTVHSVFAAEPKPGASGQVRRSRQTRREQDPQHPAAGEPAARVQRCPARGGVYGAGEDRWVDRRGAGTEDDGLLYPAGEGRSQKHQRGDGRAGRGARRSNGWGARTAGGCDRRCHGRRAGEAWHRRSIGIQGRGWELRADRHTDGDGADCGRAAGHGDGGVAAVSRWRQRG